MCLDSLGFPVMGVCSNMDWVMGEYVGLLGGEALLGHSKQYIITHCIFISAKKFNFSKEYIIIVYFISAKNGVKSIFYFICGKILFAEMKYSLHKLIVG